MAKVKGIRSPETDAAVQQEKGLSDDRLMKEAEFFVNCFSDTLFLHLKPYHSDHDIAVYRTTLTEILANQLGGRIARLAFEEGYGEGFIDGTNAPNSMYDLQEMIESSPDEGEI